MSRAVRIHRLNLEVRSRGASWLGREDLLRIGEEARRAVLGELERVLLRLTGGHKSDREAGALALHVTLRRSANGSLVCTDPSGLRNTLERTLSQALQVEAELGAEAGITHPNSQASEAPPSSLAGVQNDLPTSASRLLAMLLAWLTEGLLRDRLRYLMVVTARRWLRGIVPVLSSLREPAVEEVATRSHGFSDPHFSTRDNLGNIASMQLRAAGVPPEICALARIVECAAAFAPCRPPALAMQEALADVIDEPESEPPFTPGLQGHGPGVPEPSSNVRSSADAARVRSTPRSTPPASASTASALPELFPQRACLHTALPFLLLGPLSRCDWLATAASILEGNDESHSTHALGYALALKALPAPARGWRHAPEDLLAAAFAAGLSDPPEPTLLPRTQRQLDDQLSALDGIVADALVRGHERQKLLVLVQVGGELALVEPEGLFPLAMGSRWSELAPIACNAGAPIFVDPNLPSTLLAEVHASDLNFVVPGTATRGEVWQPLFGPGAWRGMTNAKPESAPRLLQAAQRLDGVHDTAREMLLALGPQRPLAPNVSLVSLDRSVTLAAALALAQISYSLFELDPASWQQPDPCLALERFGDLGATLIVSPREFEIRLPIGPRSRDLSRAGLLGDVPFVPWLGRGVRFGIG
jgi:hypothetical protein